MLINIIFRFGEIEKNKVNGPIGCEFEKGKKVL
jgi:hypothetical protein